MTSASRSLLPAPRARIAIPDFTASDSVVRRIWGDADAVLLIFGGAAAEFALNRAADWLFFTGALPADPVGRLFSTARFAGEVVFADEGAAEQALARIRAAHAAVETRRGQHIPAWAHRDVLYMLVAYSERAHELLHRPLSAAEQGELYAVFRRVGVGLGIPELPDSYAEWQVDRERHLARDLVRSEYTDRLYAQYRRHLGAWRYALLLHAQAGLAPPAVRALLGMRPSPWFRAAIASYRVAVRLGLRAVVHRLLLPAAHRADVQRLDQRRRGSSRLTSIVPPAPDAGPDAAPYAGAGGAWRAAGRSAGAAASRRGG